MLTKLIMLAVQGALSIFAAEEKHGAGSGLTKKKEVLRTLESQAVNLKLHDAPSSCDFADVMTIIDELIDSVVALLNCFGLLGGKK